jgi:metallophosphoesterase (TIGR03768 family)
MMYTTQVFDAAIQTANALYKRNPFDFFISLGDTCNCTMYNELRWYIDVIDGKVITPSSGAHLGADTIDYQKPFQAAGLDRSIPFYQAIGNHDHFLLGSFPPYVYPAIAQSFVSDTVWAVPDFLVPDTTTVPSVYPAMFSVNTMLNGTPKYYTGCINGSTPFGTIINAGPVGSFSSPPKIVADPNRRSLLRTEWIQEFFKTSTSPVGHGFNLVSSNPNFNLVPASDRAGFACYSFVPKSNIPLKVIVLDNTQREDDGSVDIHGHGFLDATRWAWLQAELDAGQAANQLMIIAAHIPIAVVNLAAETEWWQGGRTAANPLGDPSTTVQNGVTLDVLVKKLWATPNLLMWMSGHRHLNVVKAFPHKTVPENGFWQVETSSLHDFPQQFRTVEIYLNSDYTVSIVTVNVDPAVSEGTPAATSRKYAIAAQQITQNNMQENSVNFDVLTGTNVQLPSIDPSRAQGTPGIPRADDTYTDPSIQFVDLSKDPTRPVPYNASYNAELFKKLAPQMVAALKAKFP